MCITLGLDENVNGCVKKKVTSWKDVENSYKDQNRFFVFLHQAVNIFISAVKFNMGVYGDLPCFWASLKWPFDVLQFLALPHQLYFSASEVAAWCHPVIPNYDWLPTWSEVEPLFIFCFFILDLKFHTTLLIQQLCPHRLILFTFICTCFCMYFWSYTAFFCM